MLHFARKAKSDPSKVEFSTLDSYNGFDGHINSGKVDVPLVDEQSGSPQSHPEETRSITDKGWTRCIVRGQGTTEML